MSLNCNTNQVISWNLLALTNSLVPVPKTNLKAVFPTVICAVTKWAISFSFHFYTTAEKQVWGAYGMVLIIRALFLYSPNKIHFFLLFMNISHTVYLLEGEFIKH